MRAIGLVLSGGLAVTLVAAPASQNTAAIERAFHAFWSASDRTGAAGRIDAIIKSGVSFEDALSRIRHGRDYAGDVPRGRQFGRTRTFNGLDHRDAFVVPESYDPTRPYQVRVHLHGGAARPRPTAVNRIRTDSLPGGVEEITVFPSGWSESLSGGRRRRPTRTRRCGPAFFL